MQMTNYISPSNQIFGYDETQTDIIPKNYVKIPTKYTADQYPFLSLNSGKIAFDSDSYKATKQSFTIEAYNDAAQKNLDSVAQSWGYNSMITAVSYVASSNPQYKAEAQVLSDWRDATWTEAYTIEAGTLPSSVEEFLTMLPVAPTKPVI